MMPAPGTVHVDVCPLARQCLTSRCTAWARFSVQLTGHPKLHYCGPDARKWIATHQRLRRTVVVSDEAKRLLAEVGL